MVNISDGNIRIDFRVSLGVAEDVTLATGVAAVTRSFVNLISQATAADDCTQITGLAIGDIAVVTAEGGDTITMKDGTYLILGGDIALVGTNGDVIVLICTAAGVCTAVATYASN